MPEGEINAKFYDIINQEDWGDVDIDEPMIYRDLMSLGDIPIGNMIVPTPIPGVWINISLGFELEGPEDG